MKKQMYQAVLNQIYVENKSQIEAYLKQIKEASMSNNLNSKQITRAAMNLWEIYMPKK